MNVLDGGGATSYLVYYSMVCALVGSTLLVFIYLWFKGRLDMDEEAKYQMMLTDEERNEGM